MAPPIPVQKSAQELDEVIALFITEVDEHRRSGTRQSPEVFSSLLLSLTKQRELLRHLGQGGDTISPISHTPGTIRPDIRAREEETMMRAAQEKSEILQRLRDTMKAETDIYRMQEEERADLDKIGKMLDSMRTMLEKTPPQANLDVQFDSFLHTIRDVLQTDLLGPLTDRQAALLRFVENTEAVLETQYSKYFTAEELRHLDEVRERITQRARSFLERRTKAYQGFPKVLAQIKPATQLRTDADRHQARSLIDRVKKNGIDVMVRDGMETGRMVRLEHNEFETLADKFAS
ncbi:MAG: hypothetical protein Q7R76_00165 [Candidatus Woesearchaeota archaeon]|nr:hypothetical protein [Candidatus Woesearchaeota archaeon]